MSDVARATAGYQLDEKLYSSKYNLAEKYIWQIFLIQILIILGKKFVIYAFGSNFLS